MLTQKLVIRVAVAVLSIGPSVQDMMEVFCYS